MGNLRTELQAPVVCQADAEKCIFVWTILSRTPRRTPQVKYDAGQISARIF